MEPRRRIQINQDTIHERWPVRQYTYIIAINNIQYKHQLVLQPHRPVETSQLDFDFIIYFACCLLLLLFGVIILKTSYTKGVCEETALSPLSIDSPCLAATRQVASEGLTSTAEHSALNPSPMHTSARLLNVSWHFCTFGCTAVYRELWCRWFQAESRGRRYRSVGRSLFTITRENRPNFGMQGEIDENDT